MKDNTRDRGDSLYSHKDTCPGKPDCIHDDDEEFLPLPEGNHEKVGQALLKAINWAIEEIKRKP